MQTFYNKEPGVVAHAFKTRTQKAEAGGSLGQPGLHSEFQDSQGYAEKHCLKRRRGGGGRGGGGGGGRGGGGGGGQGMDGWREGGREGERRQGQQTKVA